VRYLLDTTVIVDHVRDYRPGAEILSRLFEETGDLRQPAIARVSALWWYGSRRQR